ncbi:MAG: hypothetical protein O9333_12115, partial [Beijerinckiaceae bacterium]|nr:hypothetical protein [Beijerinckiaceae bacterium]
MDRLQSTISVSSEAFRRHDSHNRRLVAELREKQEAARHQRPARDLERLARQKKMPARQRIEKLLDPGTPFLELSALAANMAYGGDSPSDHRRGSSPRDQTRRRCRQSNWPTVNRHHRPCWRPGPRVQETAYRDR